MDFDLSEEQIALRDLSLQVLASDSPPHSNDLWANLASTGLLGVAVPESHGGLGFGLTESALVTEAYGHTLAPVPLEQTLAAALVLAKHGTPQQQERWLPGVADGSTVLAMALEEWGVNDVRSTSVTAQPEGDLLVLNGSKPAVPLVDRADRILVPVFIAGGARLALVDPAANGLSMSANETTNHEVQSDLTFDNVKVTTADIVASLEAPTYAVAVQQLLGAATVLGSCDGAVTMTVEHANSREQFGKPLGTNQAYSQRMADASIAIDCMRVTLMQATWMHDQGLDAAEETLIATWWAADGGSKVVHATQHLHGGTGADVSYPVHRFYLAVKQRATTLGSASGHLAQLGERLAQV